LSARRDETPVAHLPAQRLPHRIIVNLLVLVTAITLAYLSIFAVGALVRKGRQLAERNDARASLPNYADFPWASRHFSELKALQTDYVSYLGWRRRPFAGETIVIDATRRIRETPQVVAAAPARAVYFFGGSAMWGTGSDQIHTIPSAFQRLAGGRVLNFGESGWCAHQSLNQLVKLYTEGHRPDVVVFYDGSNEVAEKCRSDSDFWAIDRERQIQRALTYPPGEVGYLLQPIVTAAAAARRMIGLGPQPRDYDCDADPRKAELIAEQVATDWKIAASLVTSYGGRFQAYLQPIVYFSRTRTDRLRVEPLMREQFEAVYPLIRRKMAALPDTADLSAIFDRDEYIYIDFCHISPNGNAIVAERIARDLGKQ